MESSKLWSDSRSTNGIGESIVDGRPSCPRLPSIHECSWIFLPPMPNTKFAPAQPDRFNKGMLPKQDGSLPPTIAVQYVHRWQNDSSSWWGANTMEHALQPSLCLPPSWWTRCQPMTKCHQPWQVCSRAYQPRMHPVWVPHQQLNPQSNHSWQETSNHFGSPYTHLVSSLLVFYHQASSRTSGYAPVTLPSL